MTSRIADVFVRLRADHRTGLVTYVTGGDPDAARSAEILRGLDRAGADVLEVGVPFSDPLADGPVIQRASERALAAGGSTGINHPCAVFIEFPSDVAKVCICDGLDVWQS